MITVARILSWLALGGTIVPAMLFYTGQVTLDQTRAGMLAATVVWFATAPFWMDRGESH